MFFVKKNDDTLRLNRVISKNKYPFPIIYDLFDQMQGHTIFSTIDLHSKYYRLKIKEEYVIKTSFCIRYGNYDLLVILFWLSIAPVSFIDLMNHHFGNFVIISYMTFYYTPELEKIIETI